jgi:hypothetical protein
MQFISLLLSRFAAATCDPSLNAGSFLGLPPWYKYLGGVMTNYGCVPQVQQLSDVWLIGAAIIEILLRIAALGAVIFVIVGGVQFMTSHGDPGATKKARETVINALIGLVIAVAATAVVTFIAGRFK